MNRTNTSGSPATNFASFCYPTTGVAAATVTVASVKRPCWLVVVYFCRWTSVPVCSTALTSHTRFIDASEVSPLLPSLAPVLCDAAEPGESSLPNTSPPSPYLSAVATIDRVNSTCPTATALAATVTTRMSPVTLSKRRFTVFCTSQRTRNQGGRERKDTNM